MMFWSLDRPRIGAKDIAVNNTSLNKISGVVISDCTLCGVGVGEDATVCRISPIYRKGAHEYKEIQRFNIIK